MRKNKNEETCPSDNKELYSGQDKEMTDLFKLRGVNDLAGWVFI